MSTSRVCLDCEICRVDVWLYMVDGLEEGLF